jgi:peroxiredoxin
MLSEGDETPDFTAPLSTGDIGEFTLSEALEDGPVVLAFFPAAFTGTCTHEMSEFDELLGQFEDEGVQVYGVSVDSPFAQNEFREKLGLDFGLISDSNKDLIHELDIAMDFTDLGVHDIAKRAVYVVEQDGTVSYAWVSDDPGVEPDYDEVLEAAGVA